MEEKPNKSIVIEVTDACCNRCYGCFINFKKNFMQPKDLERILKKIPDIKNSVVIFSGGEPLLHPKLKELIAIATKISGFRPYLLTSAALSFNLEAYKNLISGIIVSIKYPVDFMDDSFKGNRGAHDAATHLLKEAKYYGLNRQINWVMDDLNKDYYFQMVKLANKLGAELNILKFLNYGKFSLREIKLEEFEDYCLKARKLGRKTETIVNIFFPCKWSNGYKCGYGLNRLAIGVDGRLRACIYSAKIHGNILKESYAKIKEKMDECIVNNAENYRDKCLVEEEIKKQQGL